MKDLKITKALHGRLKSQRNGTGGKLTVDPTFSFRRERGTGKICRNSWRDGTFFFFWRQNSWRDGAVVFFSSEAGRGGCLFFPKRDGAVVVFFRGGTGRLYFFSEAGRGGCIFFSRRDGTGWLCFFSAGTGRLCFLFAPGRAFFFSAGTGRLTVVVFSAGTVLFIRVPSGEG